MQSQSIGSAIEEKSKKVGDLVTHRRDLIGLTHYGEVGVIIECDDYTLLIKVMWAHRNGYHVPEILVTL
jgi:hypothetical protein